MLVFLFLSTKRIFNKISKNTVSLNILEVIRQVFL